MMDRFCAKLGRFDFSGVATGGGHAVGIVEARGIAIPPRRRLQRTVEIDWAQVTLLQVWSGELRAKFAEAAHG